MIDAARYFALFETTTRLQATGENWSDWGHQLLRNLWKYSKIESNGGKFKSLRPPMIWQCLKIQRDCRRPGGISIIMEATSYLAMWEYSKIPGKPQIIAQCLKIQQDCRQREKMEVIEATLCENTTRFQASHQLVCNVWKYSKIAGNGGQL